MTALLDTCIIVDALIDRAPFGESAKEILRLGAEKRLVLLCSAKTLLDVHYLLKHHLHDETKVRRIILALLKAITVVDVSGSACLSALNHPSGDYEDEVQGECALEAGADYIVTRDHTGFIDSTVPAIEPSQFLDRFRSEDGE